jgi:hypothetical protein
MNEFLIWSSKFFLIIIFIFEILLFVKEKIGATVEIIVAFMIFIALVWLFYHNSHDFLKEEKSLLIFFNAIICTGIPIILMLLGNQAFAKIKSPVFKHLCLLSLSFIATFTLPICFVLISCFSGLECI